MSAVGQRRTQCGLSDWKMLLLNFETLNLLVGNFVSSKLKVVDNWMAKAKPIHGGESGYSCLVSKGPSDGQSSREAQLKHILFITIEYAISKSISKIIR